tara:strand:- start:79 stop:1254 length:1176 start_codon:yes stop_codon:yes gene_type:complete
MLKKIILTLIILFISIYFLTSNAIDNKDYKFLKIYLPSNIKQTVKYYFFPQKYKKQVENKASKYNEKIYEYFENSKITFNLKSLDNYREIRKSILNNFILNKDQIKIFKLEDNESFLKKYNILENYIDYQVYGAKYYNIKHYGILDKANETCAEKKLFIYSTGHGHEIIKSDEYLLLKSLMMGKCYDFFTLSMTGVGINQAAHNDFDFPSKIAGANPETHDEYFTYFDENYPHKKPMSLMLSGNYFLINKVLSEKNYLDVIMGGFSGGGWYSTVLPSIITEIKKSISYSGTLPLIYKSHRTSSHTDKEDDDYEFYKNSNYIDLYYLSTLDENFNSSRKHFQIYGSKDVYFQSRFAELFKKSFLLKNFEIIIDYENTHNHKLNAKKFMTLID